MPDYRQSSGIPDNRVTVIITNINLDGMLAEGRDYNQVAYSINIGYTVGAFSVVPGIGEQWMIERLGDAWHLSKRAPFQNNAVVNPVLNSTRINNPTGTVDIVDKDGSYKDRIVKATTRYSEFTLTQVRVSGTQAPLGYFTLKPQPTGVDKIDIATSGYYPGCLRVNESGLYSFNLYTTMSFSDDTKGAFSEAYVGTESAVAYARSLNRTMFPGEAFISTTSAKVDGGARITCSLSCAYIPAGSFIDFNTYQETGSNQTVNLTFRIARIG